MHCMNCGIDISANPRIRVFQNGAVHLCPTHYEEILPSDTNLYSPRRYRKYLSHPHKVQDAGIK